MQFYQAKPFAISICHRPWKYDHSKYNHVMLLLQALFDLLRNVVKNCFCQSAGLRNEKGLLRSRRSWWATVAVGDGNKQAQRGPSRGECNAVEELPGTGVVLRGDWAKTKHFSQPPPQALNFRVMNKTLKAVLTLCSTSLFGKLIQV